MPKFKKAGRRRQGSKTRRRKRKARNDAKRGK